MRTKTLIVSALVGLAGSAAVMAQSVYSLNAVGYVNTVIPPGFSIIANPLKGATNTLSGLLTSVTLANTAVYKFVDGDFDIATYMVSPKGVGTWDNDLTLAPGEGAWIFNPGTKSFTNTFVGEVSTGSLTNAVAVGFSLLGSIVPQSGQLDTDLGFPAADKDTVYLFRDNDFVICTYMKGLGWDEIPNPAVGEGFWVFTSAAKSWVRTFSLN